GRTVLVSSHILAEVAQIAGSVIILDHGQLIAQAALTELTTQTHQAVRIRTPRAAKLQDAVAADGGQARLTAPDQLEVTVLTPEQAGLLAPLPPIPTFPSTPHTPTFDH